MSLPERARRQEGTHAVVDGIHFPMPIETSASRAFLAAFTVDADRAQALLPGTELHALRLWRNRGLLMVTVVDYQKTDIGKYIEFSVGLACTFGERPAPPLLPLLLRGRYKFGQYVLDLPVSTEVSVKGGKGIWGMPKHQASLDFVVDDRRVSSQYDLDGQMVLRIDIARPKRRMLPLGFNAANYSHFRGMIIKSYVAFEGEPRLGLIRPSATLEVGPHSRLSVLRELDVSRRPIATIFYPEFGGVLDDYVESWFAVWPEVPGPVEGIESVVGLGQSQEWPEPPIRTRP